jgi:hypothetical protein
MPLFYNPCIVLLGIYPKEIKNVYRSSHPQRRTKLWQENG